MVRFTDIKKLNEQSTIGKAFQILFILTIGLGVVLPARAERVEVESAPQAAPGDMKTSYLAAVRNGDGNTGTFLITGIYPQGWPDQNTINNEMKPLDNWLSGVTGGRSTSIFGTFLPLELRDDYYKGNVETPLTVMWNAGYTPFVNLPTSPYTAQQVAGGVLDSAITKWANSYKIYANSGTRFAYIAPMQEMNGDWVSYGRDPVNYIAAFKNFQRILHDVVKVPRSSVKWVFAPNGWTRPGDPSFEKYYPGDSFVDVTAISAYNFGYCTTGAIWQEPETVFNPSTTNGRYLERLRSLAPNKPIFIAQTASTSRKTSGGNDLAETDRWLRDAYKYLSIQPNVQAVIYFNLTESGRPGCDWPVYKGSTQSPGYKTGINSNGYKYISPAELMATSHTVE